MTFIINAFKIIFLLGFLVFIHEGGHFLAARFFKIKVEEFSIGFGPKLFTKKGKETEYRKKYSLALLNSSVSKKYISACPLAFGETGIKSRIKTVLNYKKPAFIIIILFIIIMIFIYYFIISSISFHIFILIFILHNIYILPFFQVFCKFFSSFFSFLFFSPSGPISLVYILQKTPAAGGDPGRRRLIFIYV